MISFEHYRRSQAAARIRPLKSLFSFLFIVLCLAVSTASMSSAKIKASIVVDEENGKILRSYNIDARHAPASLTKMMTLYMAFDAIEKKTLSLNQLVRVSRHATARRPSKLYLRAGSWVRVRDLLSATAVKSANDAAAVLAEAIGGSESRFARMMTRKARTLGMKTSVFRNASGLPARGQITTARDMATLARAILRDHPKYYRIFSQRYFRYRNRTYRNTNRLLHRYASVDGMKTGYTRRARFNLATSAVRGNQRIIVVVLGAGSSRERYRRTVGLMASVWKTMPRGKLIAVRSNGNNLRRVTRQRLHLVSSAHAGVRTRYQRVYGIQVTATRYYSRARKALRRAQRRLPLRYRLHTRSVIQKARTRSGRRYYQARLIGMRASVVRRACYILKRRGMRCRTLSVRQRTTYIARIKSKRPARTSHRRYVRGKKRHAYAIQVAASSSYRKARKAAFKARRALPGRIKYRTRVAVLSPRSYRGRFYRARVTGLSKGQAQRACSILARRNINCLSLYQG